MQANPFPPCLDAPDNPARDEDRKFALLCHLPRRQAALLVRQWRVSRAIDVATVVQMMGALRQRGREQGDVIEKGPGEGDG